MGEIGEVIEYTHRAAVGRYRGRKDGMPARWVLFEGVNKDEVIPNVDPLDAEESSLRYMFANYPKEPHGINKTIFVWPEDGEGFLIGEVRRGIGKSVKASGGYNYFGDDFELGYFSPTEGFHRLLVVKRKFYGTDYILVPEFGVKNGRTQLSS